MAGIGPYEDGTLKRIYEYKTDRIKGDMQNKVKKFVEEYNLSCGAAVRYIDLVSEIGELGKEILKATEYGQKDSGVNDAGGMEEMGDCIFSLLALCSEMDMEAHEALDYALEKYKRRFRKKGSIGSEKENLS